jgi:hypothetical protein
VGAAAEDDAAAVAAVSAAAVDAQFARMSAAAADATDTRSLPPQDETLYNSKVRQKAQRWWSKARLVQQAGMTDLYHVSKRIG